MQEFVLFDEKGNDVCQVTIEEEIAHCNFEGSNMGLAGLMLVEIYENDLTNDQAEPGSYPVEGTIYTIKKY